MPAQICGFEFDYSDLSELKNISTSPCERDIWEDGRCFWHHQSDEKDREEVIQRWEDEDPDRIDQLVLRNVELGDEIDFSETVLFSADFSGSDLTGCDFSKSRLHYADFTNSILSNSEFTNNTIAKKADFSQSKALNADFSQSDFSNAYFNSSTLVSSKFHGTKLPEAEFPNADLREAAFDSTVLEQGDEITGAANLRVADLSEANLYRTTLNGCNLERASLAEADIRDTDLRYCKTYRADFRNVRANSLTKLGRRSPYELEADWSVSNQFGTDYDSLRTVSNTASRLWNRFLTNGRQIDGEKLQKGILVYRVYRRIFEENPDPRERRKFSIAEKDSTRKRHLERGDKRGWLKWSLYRSVMYYGESPKVVLASAAVCISIFASVQLAFGVNNGGVIYQYCLNCSGSVVEAIGTALRLSLGDFFPGSGSSLTAQQAGQIVSRVESAVGTLYLSLFAFVLGRRAAE